MDEGWLKEPAAAHARSLAGLQIGISLPWVGWQRMRFRPASRWPLHFDARNAASSHWSDPFGCRNCFGRHHDARPPGADRRRMAGAPEREQSKCGRRPDPDSSPARRRHSSASPGGSQTKPTGPGVRQSNKTRTAVVRGSAGGGARPGSGASSGAVARRCARAAFRPYERAPANRQFGTSCRQQSQSEPARHVDRRSPSARRHHGCAPCGHPGRGDHEGRQAGLPEARRVPA